MTLCILQNLEFRLKSIDESVSHLPNFSKFESDALKVSRDITSARADMKRLEGRVIQSTEDFAATKTEVTKLGKFCLGQHNCDKSNIMLDELVLILFL